MQRSYIDLRGLCYDGVLMSFIVGMVYKYAYMYSFFVKDKS